jgi:hypothetical protein
LAKNRVTLIDLEVGILSVVAFHEKAGRSQVDFLFSLDKAFSSCPLRPAF